MKWIQVDTDMPHDPRIQGVLQRFGNAGLGMLVRLWCFIGAHGKRKPGWSLDSRGKPIGTDQIAIAIGADVNETDSFLHELVQNGHVQKKTRRNAVIYHIPAMSTRADTYAKRRVRTMFEHSSNIVPLQDKTIQDKTSTKNPPTPLKRGARISRAELKHAEQVRNRVYLGCPHEPRCTQVAACVQAIALARKQQVES